MKKKSRIYDATPLGWRTLGRYQRRQVLEFLFERFAGHEITVTPIGISLRASSEFDLPIDSIVKVLNSLAKADPSKVEQELAKLSCGDTSCLIWPSSMARGQTTNGGCRCFSGLPQQDRVRVQQIVLLLKNVDQEADAKT
jgi:hypothetical protein